MTPEQRVKQYYYLKEWRKRNAYKMQQYEHDRYTRKSADPAWMKMRAEKARLYRLRKKEARHANQSQD